jgi:Fic family protein
VVDHDLGLEPDGVVVALDVPPELLLGPLGVELGVALDLLGESMLRQGYWLTEFLSISRILKKAPAQYARSFLYTESDDRDTTYFLLYQLSVMCRALDELHEYLARKIREVRKAEELLRDTNLNHRQLAVIGHALRNHDAEYTFRTHMTSHRVVYESARSDLLELERLGFLVRTQIGRQFVFRPARDLSERLNGAKRGGGNFRALQL